MIEIGEPWSLTEPVANVYKAVARRKSDGALFTTGHNVQLVVGEPVTINNTAPVEMGVNGFHAHMHAPMCFLESMLHPLGGRLPREFEPVLVSVSISDSVLAHATGLVCGRTLLVHGVLDRDLAMARQNVVFRDKTGTARGHIRLAQGYEWAGGPEEPSLVTPLQVRWYIPNAAFLGGHSMSWASRNDDRPSIISRENTEGDPDSDSDQNYEWWRRHDNDRAEPGITKKWMEACWLKRRVCTDPVIIHGDGKLVFSSSPRRSLGLFFWF